MLPHLRLDRFARSKESLRVMSVPIISRFRTGHSARNNVEETWDAPIAERFITITRERSCEIGRPIAFTRLHSTPCAKRWCDAQLVEQTRSGGRTLSWERAKGAVESWMTPAIHMSKERHMNRRGRQVKFIKPLAA